MKTFTLLLSALLLSAIGRTAANGAPGHTHCTAVSCTDDAADKYDIELGKTFKLGHESCGSATECEAFTTAYTGGQCQFKCGMATCRFGDLGKVASTEACCGAVAAIETLQRSFEGGPSGPAARAAHCAFVQGLEDRCGAADAADQFFYMHTTRNAEWAPTYGGLIKALTEGPDGQKLQCSTTEKGGQTSDGAVGTGAPVEGDSLVEDNSASSGDTLVIVAIVAGFVAVLIVVARCLMLSTCAEPDSDADDCEADLEKQATPETPNAAVVTVASV